MTPRWMLFFAGIFALALAGWLFEPKSDPCQDPQAKRVETWVDGVGIVRMADDYKHGPVFCNSDWRTEGP